MKTNSRQPEIQLPFIARQWMNALKVQVKIQYVSKLNFLNVILLSASFYFYLTATTLLFFADTGKLFVQ